MNILVTGGTGVVGRSAVTALVNRGHTVRLLSRHATLDAAAWPNRVEPWPADIGSAVSVTGSAGGCDAVLHLAGIVDETGPESTFERINVLGTRHLVYEAERAGCPRFVFVSSLGAAAGNSPYHRSKLAAEDHVRSFAGDWVVIRPGAVYGPGDEQLSVLLRHV
jgi:nucleoside-diphosphate-sugar epimerase